MLNHRILGLSFIACLSICASSQAANDDDDDAKSKCEFAWMSGEIGRSGHQTALRKRTEWGDRAVSRAVLAAQTVTENTENGRDRGSNVPTHEEPLGS
jgi:hypothetical protein